MLATKAQGGLRAFKFPFPQEGSGPEDFVEYNTPGVSLTHLKTAFNERYAFAGSTDGSIWIFKLNDKEGRIARQEKDWSFSEEVLVPKSELKESYQLLTELKTKVENLKNDSDIQLRQKDNAHTSKLKEISDKFSIEIDSLKDSTAGLEQDYKSSIEQNRADLLSLRKENNQQLQEVKQSFVEKLESEKNRYASLVDRRNQLEAQWQYRMNQLAAEHQDNTEEIQKYFKKKIDDMSAAIAKKKRDASKYAVKHEENIQEITEDIDRECLEISYAFQNKLKEEKLALQSVQVENLEMKVTFQALVQEVDDHKKQLLDCEKEARRLTECIKKLESDIMGLNLERKEREDTIVDKEKRVYDLKKKNQELEKFKFVLDYKIIELKKQIEPREMEIELLKKQIEEMSLELKGYGLKHLDLEKSLDDLVLKNQAASMRKSTEYWRNQQIKAIMNSVQQDVANAVKYVKDVDQLKRICTRIYHTYRDINEKPSEWAPPDIVSQLSNSGNSQDVPVCIPSKGSRTAKIANLNEDAKARKQLEAQLLLLKKDAEKGKKKLCKDSLKMTQEGMHLNQYRCLTLGS
jgi:chromosome segregation ATPase